MILSISRRENLKNFSYIIDNLKSNNPKISYVDYFYDEVCTSISVTQVFELMMPLLDREYLIDKVEDILKKTVKYGNIDVSLSLIDNMLASNESVKREIAIYLLLEIANKNVSYISIILKKLDIFVGNKDKDLSLQVSEICVELKNLQKNSRIGLLFSKIKSYFSFN